MHALIFCFTLSWEDTVSEDSLQVVQNKARWALLEDAQLRGEKGLESSLCCSHAPWHDAASGFYSNSHKGPIGAASHPL